MPKVVKSVAGLETPQQPQEDQGISQPARGMPTNRGDGFDREFEPSGELPSSRLVAAAEKQARRVSTAPVVPELPQELAKKVSSVPTDSSKMRALIEPADLTDPVRFQKVLNGILSDKASAIPAGQSVETASVKAAIAVEAMHELLRAPLVEERIANNPTLLFWREQAAVDILNVLRDLKDPPEDFPHKKPLPTRYPWMGTHRALENANRFLTAVFSSPSTTDFRPSDVTFVPMNAADGMKQQQAVVKRLTEAPLAEYSRLSAILKKDQNAPFEEVFIGGVAVLLGALGSEDVVNFARQDPAFARLHQRAWTVLQDAKNNGCPYMDTLLAFNEAVSALDIMQRAVSKGSSELVPEPLYHAFRYGYHEHQLISGIPEHLILPLAAPVGATDLLKLCGIPIGVVGIHPEITRVDAHVQTSREFWLHDINHARRMFAFKQEEFEALKEAKIKQAVTDEEKVAAQSYSFDAFVQGSAEFVERSILPLIDTNRSLQLSPDEIAERRLIKMIFFEILHEDALAPTQRAICEAMLRPPGAPSPFEHRSDDQRKVTYYMQAGAAIAPFVVTKLGGAFYDEPGDRKAYIVPMSHRTPEAVVRAMNRIAKHFGVESLEDYARDQGGMPAAALLEALAAAKTAAELNIDETTVEVDEEQLAKGKEDPAYKNLGTSIFSAAAGPPVSAADGPPEKRLFFKNLYVRVLEKLASEERGRKREKPGIGG